MLQAKYKYILIFISFFTNFFLFWPNAKSQTYNWKRLRYEVLFGVGATNFMGDVGAEVDKGITSYVWVNPQAIRPVFTLGGRMSVKPNQKIRINLAVGMLYNDDRYGASPTRFLQFRSPIVEFSGIYEYYIIREQKKKTR